MNKELEKYYCTKLIKIITGYIERYDDFRGCFDDFSFYIVEEEDMEDDVDDGLEVGDYLSNTLFGAYACLIARRVESETFDGEILDDFLAIVNEMMASGDLDITNLVFTGVFESPLVDTPKCIKFMRKVLKGKALECYENVVFNFGVDVPPDA